jgi:arsenate reductase-like glutaredoxin family protein
MSELVLVVSWLPVSLAPTTSNRSSNGSQSSDDISVTGYIIYLNNKPCPRYLNADAKTIPPNCDSEILSKQTLQQLLSESHEPVHLCMRTQSNLGESEDSNSVPLPPELLSKLLAQPDRRISSPSVTSSEDSVPGKAAETMNRTVTTKPDPTSSVTSTVDSVFTPVTVTPPKSSLRHVTNIDSPVPITYISTSMESSPITISTVQSPIPKTSITGISEEKPKTISSHIFEPSKTDDNLDLKEFTFRATKGRIYQSLDPENIKTPTRTKSRKTKTANVVQPHFITQQPVYCKPLETNSENTDRTVNKKRPSNKVKLKKVKESVVEKEQVRCVNEQMDLLEMFDKLDMSENQKPVVINQLDVHKKHKHVAKVVNEEPDANVGSASEIVTAVTDPLEVESNVANSKTKEQSDDIDIQTSVEQTIEFKSSHISPEPARATSSPVEIFSTQPVVCQTESRESEGSIGSVPNLAEVRTPTPRSPSKIPRRSPVPPSPPPDGMEDYLKQSPSRVKSPEGSHIPVAIPVGKQADVTEFKVDPPQTSSKAVPLTPDNDLLDTLTNVTQTSSVEDLLDKQWHQFLWYLDTIVYLVNLPRLKFE